MTETLKPDADKIVAHLEDLKKQSWLAKSQKWWPDHLFHFTDILNAVSILNGGALLSRSRLERSGACTTDIASPDVIAATASRWKDYVRLYFRPRTPTQYRNEGFRPVGQRQLGGAHCPVPIVFIFDSKSILTKRSTRFSDGNLAAGADAGESSHYFASLPFQKIYHDGSLWNFADGEKRNIIFHRHAEVIVPDSLDLSSLKLIWCRCQAEFESFLYLLPSKVRQKWSKKIGSGNKPLLFFNRWSFVEKADLSSSEISFTFNPQSSTPGPFHAKLEISEKRTKTVYSWESRDFYARGTEVFSLSKLEHPEHYIVKLLLDDQLAYQNSFIAESGLPF